ncbi:facilitated trehalose transporter Tret1-like isoform X2 [Penaeus monodon]|uniref:facilitated trehalose transporter Tret1-like isoform X2 n=1 Tax=Penaeus monodon TaxID=6687 RepID=UPI0018A7DAE1|nr:facilitated trehalose transporter Tret1-like isoform X2 [Penaeus monodon]
MKSTAVPEPGAADSALPSVETASDKRIRLFKQTIIVMSVCVTFTVFAVSSGWINPALSDMNRDQTSVYGTAMILEPWEADMLGSLVAVGMIPGAWLGGWMGTRIGRRHSLMILQVPAVLGWILIALAYNPVMIHVGRVLQGINSGASGVIANSYIVEVSDTAYRGTFASLPGIFICFGSISTLALGFVLRWFQIPYVGIALSLVAAALLSFLPESPTYLTLSGKEEEARKILASLRGPSVDVEMEMETVCKMNENKIKGSFRSMLHPRVWRSIVVICILMFFQSFCGFVVVVTFTTRIFIESGAAVDDKVAALLVIVVMMAGFIISTITIDKFGRKSLLVISTCLIALFSFLMGTYSYLENDRSMEVSVSLLDSNTTTVENIGPASDNDWWWVPVVCMMGITVSGSLGISPVAWILSAEYFPTSVRTKCMAITSTMVSVWSFAALQLYSPLLRSLTAAGLFWFYGGMSVIAAVFCLTCVAETKNKAIG